MKMLRNVGLVAVVLVAWILPMQVSAQEDSARAYYFAGGVPSVLPDELSTKSEMTIFGGGDGTYESGFGFAYPGEVEFVQFFQFPSENGRLLAFEACFYSFGDEVRNFEYEFHIFAAGAEGEDQEPGALIESWSDPYPITVGQGLNNLSCHVLDFSDLGNAGEEGLAVSERSLYLGVAWNAEEFPSVLVAVDTNGNSSGAGWGRMNDLNSDWWVPLGPTPTFAAYRNLGIRTAWTGSDPGGGEDLCQNDLQNGVVCLRDNRFELTGTWTDFADPANTQPLIWTPVQDINATAGFQNNPSGIQVVMRIADSCASTNEWWIWLGGFTDAGWDITVRDTITNTEQTYTRTRNGGVFPTTESDRTTFYCD